MEENFKCRSCGSKRVKQILDLGMHPWCNAFLSKSEKGKEKKYPLNLCRCEKCTLLQIDYTVPKETMFSDHTYVSGTTKTLTTHFRDLAKENIEQFNLKETDFIYDIGGNDGTQMRQYVDLGIKNSINVESAKNIADISIQNGITTIVDYFNEPLVENILDEGKFKKAKLINASGVFFHLEELHSVIKGIKLLLKDDGVFVVQCMYAGDMIDNLAFDGIYHEHLCYYTLYSLEYLLRQYGLVVFDAYHSDIHSGSIIVKVKKEECKKYKTSKRYYELKFKDTKYVSEDAVLEFAEKVRNSKGILKKRLKELKNQGKSIYCYGAPAKGNTLLNYMSIDSKIIDKVVEINHLKTGLFTPGTHIPIVSEIEADRPDYYLLLSHNFKKEIMEKNKNIIKKGTKFIIPFPELEIIP